MSDKRSLRCLFVIDSLGSGGAQRQMVTLARALQARGHSIVIFTYYQHQHFLEDVLDGGIPVVTAPKRARLSTGVILALRKQLRRSRYDAVLAYLATPNLYAELANIGPKRAPLVVSERSVYPPGRLPARVYGLQQAHRLADAIVVNSHHQRDRMLRRFSWMKAKLITITNGVDLARFAPATGPVAGGDTEHLELQLLALGNIVENKNVLGLIKALALLRRTYHIEVRVRWVGKRSYTAAGMRLFDNAELLLKQYDLVANWEWLGERADIPDLLRSHDALVHPSFYEGMANAICEALACGRPVLASDVSDHRKLIQEQVTGFLFDPASPEQIASAIYRFACLSPSARSQAGHLARLFAETTLAEERCVDEYEGLFCQLRGRGGLRI